MWCRHACAAVVIDDNLNFTSITTNNFRDPATTVKCSSSCHISLTLSLSLSLSLSLFLSSSWWPIPFPLLSSSFFYKSHFHFNHFSDCQLICSIQKVNSKGSFHRTLGELQISILNMANKANFWPLPMKVSWVFGVVMLLIGIFRENVVEGFEGLNTTVVYEQDKYGWINRPLMVGLTLIPGAAAKGAVCLDGSSPAYHLHRGYGSGANSWLVQLEGGGWCDTIRNCAYRKTTRHGSSRYMEKYVPFTGILSNKASENPDFYNWNRVKIRYCDGASFSGNSQNEAAMLYFRGQRIWSAAMEELMSQGMHQANQALLSGCSAGGLATILHCDEFRALFPGNTRVKCLSDAGLFLDAVDVSGRRTMRRLFGGLVHMQGVAANLPQSCTNHLNPALCFFPQRLISSIKTPLFLVNAAYDSWQLQASLAPASADPQGYWYGCKLNNARCSASQIQFLQGFRRQMLRTVRVFGGYRKNGYFINSCFAHCQTEKQDTWFGPDSPHIGNKGIAESVGNWYFDRVSTKIIDCPYPCDRTCHNLVFSHL